VQHIHIVTGIIFVLDKKNGVVVVVIVWYRLELQLPVQSVFITTEVVSVNPADGKVYSKQHYAIKFVSDLQ